MITLDELKLQIRQRADMVHSNFVSDSELTSYINSSIAELYDLLCEAYGSDYFVEEYEFTTTDEAAYELPENFYELKRLDLQVDGNNWVTVPRFNLNEETALRSSSYVYANGYINCRYRLIGNTLKLAPLPSPGTAARALIVPLPIKLVDGSDELQDFNYYSEYVIVDCVIKCKQKEESDVQVEMVQKQEQKARIVSKADTRDAANSEQVTDIYAVNYNYFNRVR